LMQGIAHEGSAPREACPATSPTSVEAATSTNFILHEEKPKRVRRGHRLKEQVTAETKVGAESALDVEEQERIW
jgi:hypothetical protein